MDRDEIEKRAEQAKTHFKSGYNCSQSVALAFADIMELDPTLVLKISASFGAGMGRMREVCGTVSAMSLIASFLSPNTSLNDIEAKKANYALVQHFAEQFRTKNGNIVCRRLLGLECEQQTPNPSPRTATYYAKRPCAEYVYDAAKIVAQYIYERQNTI